MTNSTHIAHPKQSIYFGSEQNDDSNALTFSEFLKLHTQTIASIKGAWLFIKSVPGMIQATQLSSHLLYELFTADDPDHLVDEESTIHDFLKEIDKNGSIFKDRLSLYKAIVNYTESLYRTIEKGNSPAARKAGKQFTSKGNILSAVYTIGLLETSSRVREWAQSGLEKLPSDQLNMRLLLSVYTQEGLNTGISEGQRVILKTISRHLRTADDLNQINEFLDGLPDQHKSKALEMLKSAFPYLKKDAATQAKVYELHTKGYDLQNGKWINEPFKKIPKPVAPDVAVGEAPNISSSPIQDAKPLNSSELILAALENALSLKRTQNQPYGGMAIIGVPTGKLNEYRDITESFLEDMAQTTQRPLITRRISNDESINEILSDISKLKKSGARPIVALALDPSATLTIQTRLWKILKVLEDNKNLPPSEEGEPAEYAGDIFFAIVYEQSNLNVDRKQRVVAQVLNGLKSRAQTGAVDINE